MGPAGMSWARDLPDARPGRDRQRSSITAKLVAVAYYLAERNHEKELIKFINFACRCADTTQSAIRQKPPPDQIGGADNKNAKGDENQSRADHNVNLKQVTDIDKIEVAATHAARAGM